MKRILLVLLLVGCSSPNHSEHVTNGTFNSDLTGWEQSGAGSVSWNNSEGGAMFFEPSTATATRYQTITGLIPDTQYLYRFSLKRNNENFNIAAFNVRVIDANSTILYNENFSNLSTDYVHITTIIVPITDRITLLFLRSSTFAVQNGILVDNVSFLHGSL